MGFDEENLVPNTRKYKSKFQYFLIMALDDSMIKSPNN